MLESEYGGYDGPPDDEWTLTPDDIREMTYEFENNPNFTIKPAMYGPIVRALVSLRADAERLDWWEAQRTNTLAPVMDAEGWRLHEADHLRPLRVPFTRTLREAIDAARDAARGAGEA